MWDLCRLGLEPLSPSLAGGFLTTAPPGKPLQPLFLQKSFFPASFSLSFPSGTPVTHKLDLLILRYWSLALHISLGFFFLHLFLFSSDWVVSMDQSSSSLSLSFVIYTLLLSPFTILKNCLVLYFFSLKFFIYSFYFSAEIPNLGIHFRYTFLPWA